MPTLEELPSITAVLSTGIPTLHHVPKALRDRWARLLHSLLREVCESPFVDSGWVRLFMCCKCLLASPAAGHRLRWRKILKLVWSCMVRWEEGGIPKLWSDAVSGACKLIKRQQAQTVGVSQKSHNICRAKFAVQEGRYWKAIQALTSAGLADVSEDVVGGNVGKTPSVATGQPSSMSCTTTVLNEVIVRKGVLSFLRGSAPGPSGLRPSHLREATTCPLPNLADQLLSTLSRFVNLLASAGQVP